MTTTPLSLYEVDDSHLLKLAADSGRALEEAYVGARASLEVESVSSGDES